MKSLSILISFMVIVLVAGAQQSQYSRARIYLDAKGHTLRDLSGLGLAVDHGEYKKGTWFTSDFSAGEIEKARQAGFKVDIIIGDVVQHYQDQAKKKEEKTTAVSCNLPLVTDPVHFHYGSYAGGYFSYTEALAILDSMQLLYPGLISTRQAIDTFHSIEGRPIYWLRISNNPATDQPAKPQMLVSALHHAREPGSLSATIYYMWYLLEHYSTDPHIKAIIDNTELYFVPIVNPDGYLYNIGTNPMGGGMLRKNRRLNGDGTHGVDLNRNYGYEWGYDNFGSSPHDTDDTYRGTAAFSEPETQAMKWFAEQHHFKLNLNYHTYNNDIIYPWGYIPSYQTNDSALFFADGSFITSGSKYRYGTCNEMLDYVSNGDSDDWMYGDTTTKPRAYAFTPEVGSISDGFYPPTSSILPDCRNNLVSNLNTASLLLPFATVAGTDEKIWIQSSGYLHYTLQRLGFPDTATYTLQVLPLDSWLTVSAAPRVYTGLAMLQQVADSVSYSISPGTPNGQLVRYVLQLNNGFYTQNDTVQFYYGKYHSVTIPSTDSMAAWNNSGWGVCTSVYYTPPASIKSSIDCIGNYPDNADLTISTASSIDLTHATEAWIQFYGKWALESSFDFVMLEASPAGLGSWQPLCGRYTRQGTTYEYSQPYIYDGFQSTWVQEQVDLGDYLGQKIDLQFELLSDPQINYDGFYFDNFEVRTVEDSAYAAGLVGVSTVSRSAVDCHVFPNPASDELTVTVIGNVSGIPLTAVLYDCSGREALRFPVDQPNTVVDTRLLPAGFYFLKIGGDGITLPVRKVNILR